ncbi:TPA: phage antirepressor Ant [Escherichia coli]|uniref:antA/AntB antirepressor family protein n=1 Tax=Escherichia coli TaxID=562 RepID=UPI00287A4F5E|nr:antA/AntB antirepressor family protein [Escherichia coli]MDS1715733.1 antA/AntB antirepressor family protein [Escherichia coli]HAW2021075.1 phage antirepressor Ant [Escherichia coli]
MSTQLISVFNGTISNETTLLCNARDLHAFLGIGKVFAAWITSRIAEYGFTENQDYILLSKTGKQSLRGRGGHNRKDYHLTLDTAKELAMVERNEKGRQIRRYFIECEKKLQQKIVNSSVDYAIDILVSVRNNQVTHVEYRQPGELMTLELCIHILRKKGWVVMSRNDLLNIPLAQLMPSSFHTGTCVR